MVKGRDFVNESEPTTEPRAMSGTVRRSLDGAADVSATRSSSPRGFSTSISHESAKRGTAVSATVRSVC
jgi:hypothetical protein